MNLFSHCVLTASDERQAHAFETLIERRTTHGLYPNEVSFHVYSDPPGRVGSGGGTLWALHRLYQDLGYDPAKPAKDAPTVLIVHGAGESRRLPLYAPEGKLFAPVPALSNSVVPPVVLDLQLGLFLRFPWEPGQVIVSSGDVVIDFDTSAIGRFSTPITGFGASSSLEQGSRHGVFKFASDLNGVEDYYQKARIDFLRRNARVESTGGCAVDTGIVVLQKSYVSCLFELSQQHLADGETLLAQLERGAVRFELYLEQLYASLGALEVNEYQRRLDGRSSLSPADRHIFFEHLHGMPLSAHLARNCRFIHIGDVGEFPQAARQVAASGITPFYHFGDAAELPPHVVENVTFACVGSDVPSVTSKALSYVENCAGEVDIRFDGGGIVAGVDRLERPMMVADGFCVDIRTADGTSYAAVYHANDSFRPCDLSSCVYAGVPLADWLHDRHLTPADLGIEGSDPVDLYDLPLFAPGPTAEGIRAYMVIPQDLDTWRNQFLSSERLSLRALNAASDPAARDQARSVRRAARLRRRVLDGAGWHSAFSKDLASATVADDRQRLSQLAGATIEPILSDYRHETLSSLGFGANPVGRPSGNYRFVSAGAFVPTARAVKSDQIVWARSPVRLDLGGGWTDTPPYTNLYGGAVTNVAVDLNGQPPIQVFVRPRNEPTVIFHSIDLGEREEIVDARSIRSYKDPQAHFALPRAACALLGLGEEPLEQTLTRLGGGFELSLLAAVPKGSGLGTSSVLGGVLLAALLRYFGLSCTPAELYLAVLELEQMLTTGGGWQDQIGGLAGGVKYIESRPGATPDPIVYQLDPTLFENPHYADRMTLYYTGVTRLARNILGDVVKRVNRRDPAFLFTHHCIRALAAQARTAVSLRDYDGLSKVIALSWQENKLIHASTTNDEIDALLAEHAETYSSVKLLGAGGGGYALFVSETARDAERLREGLTVRSPNNRARVVDCSLNRTGLQVTVS